MLRFSQHPISGLHSARKYELTEQKNGGRDRRRSGDPTLFRRVLCQLSYSTVLEDARMHPPTLAVPTGLEPATSGLTGRRELQLHHGTTCLTTMVLAPPTGFEPVPPP